MFRLYIISVTNKSCYRSIFYQYLCSLRNREIGLLLCQYFRARASLHDATADNKLFYSGQLADSFDGVPDDDIQAGAKITSRHTALHDAVKAANYPVVAHLVRSGFGLTIRDSEGKTPLETVEHILQSGFNSARIKSTRTVEEETIDQQYHNIKRVLSQEQPRRGPHDSLPLGWKSVPVSENLQAYMETSVKEENDILPITFQKPHVSLLQDEQIAIAKKKYNGKEVTYLLNPIRFLRRSDQESLDMFRHTEASNSDTLAPLIHNKNASRYNVNRTRPLRGKSQRTGSFPATSSLVPHFISSSSKIPSSRATYMEETLGLMKLSQKEIFDDMWYRGEIRRIKNPQIDAFADERFWYRASARSIYILWTTTSDALALYKWNFLLLFFPMCILSRALHWSSNQQIAYSTLAMAPLVPNLSYHISVICRTRVFQHNLDLILMMTSLLSEAIVCQSFLPQNDTSLH
jgi:hypothetical protein